MGHIGNDATQQDVTSYLSIVEALLLSFKSEFLFMSLATFMFENYTRHQNIMFRVVEPFIAPPRRFRVASVLNSEAQRGKVPADRRFSVDMR